MSDARRQIAISAAHEPLRPTYGPDEDRNFVLLDEPDDRRALRPTYGPDEDRNGRVPCQTCQVPELRPTYGPDEDRN